MLRSQFLTEIQALEERLARHKACDDQVRGLKADIRATENTEQALVAAAREKIDRSEARRVIVEHLHQRLIQTYEAYLREDQQSLVAAVENLHSKYAVTLAEVETRRNAAKAKLQATFRDLGYE